MHISTIQAFAELATALKNIYGNTADMKKIHKDFVLHIPAHKPWTFATADGVYRFTRTDTKEVRDFVIKEGRVAYA